MPLEESREVRLIGEAGPQRNIGERGVGGVEQATRALEPKREQMLMWRSSDRLLEGTREMRWRQSRDASEGVDREMRVWLCIHHFEDATPNGWRESAPDPWGRRRRDARMLHELESECRGEGLDERDAAGRSITSFVRQRTDDVLHLCAADSVDASERDRCGVVLAQADETIESQWIDGNANVGVRTRGAHPERKPLAGGVQPSRARLERHRTITVRLFDLDRDRSLVGVHAEIVMRKREIIDLGDVVASRLEQDSRPIEGLRGRDTTVVAHRNDSSRRAAVEQWNETSHSTYHGHSLLIEQKRSTTKRRFVQDAFDQSRELTHQQ